MFGHLIRFAFFEVKQIDSTCFDRKVGRVADQDDI